MLHIKEEQIQGQLPSFRDGEKHDSLTARNVGENWEFLPWPKVKTRADFWVC